jgi:hypothetical protein
MVSPERWGRRVLLVRLERKASKALKVFPDSRVGLRDRRVTKVTKAIRAFRV